MSDCPLPLDILPKPLQKHADPTSSLPLRMMGAKGLVPAVAPVDLATLLYALSFDQDPQVHDTAARTAEGLPQKIFSVALQSEGLRGQVIDWLADRLASSDTALELLLLNPSTLDETVARLAPIVSQRLTDIIRQNELRLLRHDEIIRQLCRNPNALASSIDGACDFCVRNGLLLLDVTQMVESYKRVHGIDPTVQPPPPGETAAGLMAEYHGELAVDTAPPMREETEEEGRKKLTITQRILKMSVAEKIKLATLGNKEARTLLLRDSNKLVCMAAVTSPRMTDGEVLGLSNSRTAISEVLRYIYSNREFLKTYAVRMALVKNPKVPLPTALKLMQSLHERDIKELARDRNVPNTIQSQAKSHVMKKEAASKGAGDKH